MFIFASGLILLCGVTGLFARLMDHIPQAISAAMLAGILLRFGLDAFASLQLNFPLSAGMGLAYLLSRRYQPRYAIVLTLAAGLAIAALQGNIQLTQHVPAFRHAGIYRAALQLADAAGHRRTLLRGDHGFAERSRHRHAAGGGLPRAYVTADRSTALTALRWRRSAASRCARRDHRRYLHGAGRASRSAAALYGRGAAGGFYLLAGLFGGAIGLLFSALPVALIRHHRPGWRRSGTIGGSLQRALHDEKQRDAALIAFITASGVKYMGIWSGLLGHCRRRHRPSAAELRGEERQA